jgi:mRNA-degrading endonuclease RelE of RelBE toxin-antitoxin system
MKIAFQETSNFTKALTSLATDEEYSDLQNELDKNPEKGKVIKETGGARKLRMGVKGSGKRGGARVIYYYRSSSNVIYMLDIYAKNEKDSLSKSEKKELAKIIRAIEGESHE